MYACTRGVEERMTVCRSWGMAAWRTAWETRHSARAVLYGFSPAEVREGIEIEVEQKLGVLA